jgi:ATP/maltotriose-dependent transcriptional regulator MalT
LQHTGSLPFELVVSKLRRSSGRPGTVRRSLLIERLARGDPRPVVRVVAPPGYGKTTLLAQWAERNGQAFAWERLCGPLCEAVLDRPGGSATLAYLARSNLLLVPLDSQGEWYRYHHLFRDMLLAELRRQEPELIPVLRRRAAGWCLRNDLPEEALEYSIAADDGDASADLPEEWGVRAYRQGKIAAVQRWLRWLEDRGETEGHPMEVVMAGFLQRRGGNRRA